MHNAYCATLGMYDWPETRPAIDLLWQHLKEALNTAGLAIDEALTLDRKRAAMDIWQDPALVLGQTCGFPYLKYLQEKTRLLGTPRYTAHGCRDGHYVSWIMARETDQRTTLLDFADSPLAINDLDSQSGCNALRLALSELAYGTSAQDTRFIERVQRGFFSQCVVSGSHRNSLHAVAEKRADICAIDPVCLALAKQHDASIVGALKIIGKTPETASLPFVISESIANQTNLQQLQRTLKSAMSNLPSQLQRELHLEGFVSLENHHYQPIVALSDRAKQMNITKLARDQSGSMST